MKRQIGLFIMVYFLSAFLLFGQENPDSTANRFLGLGFSPSLFKSDLNPNFNKPGIDIAASFQFAAKRWLNVGFAFHLGQVQAENREVKFTDQSEFQINEFASTSYQSVYITPTIHFVKKTNYSIYLSQGFGFFRFTVRDQFGNNLQNQLNTRAPGEDFTNFAVVLPSMLNAYYFFTKGYGVLVQCGFLNPQSDYLDNISSFGNPDNNENILLIQFKLLKKL